MVSFSNGKYDERAKLYDKNLSVKKFNDLLLAFSGTCNNFSLELD